MVHASGGLKPPACEHLMSEPAIVAGIANATLGARSVVDWDKLVADYGRIRDPIEDVFPIFEGYNARIPIPGGFHLTSPPASASGRPRGKGEFPAVRRSRRGSPAE